MHLVAACHRYHPVPGGSERIAQLLAEAAARAGHRVTVVTQLEPGSPDQEVLNGVRVVRLRMRRGGGIRFPQRYLRTLRELRPDLFHLHGNRIWCADFYLPAARIFPWRQLGTGHGFYQYEVDPRPWDRWYFERYFPRVLAGLDRYVCDTEHERGQLLSWGFPPEQLELIPLGADTAEFLAPAVPPSEVRSRWGISAPSVAVYAGGFFPNKRVDRLIEAVATTGGAWGLVALGRDVPGSRSSMEACRALARARGVEFYAPGAVDRSELVASLRSADAVVLGSQYEGFGVLLAEALAAGKPFVAFATGAAPEMARSGGGSIATDVNEFGRALQRLSDTGARASAAEAAQKASTEWSEATMVRRYLALYERLLGAPAIRAGR